jgi:formylglycine-generating enzyme required for sulfatase activity
MTAMESGTLHELERYRADIVSELLMKPPPQAEQRHLVSSVEGHALDYIEVLRMPRDGAQAWSTVRDWRDLCVRKVYHGRWRHMNEPEMNLLRRAKHGGVASYLRHEVAADARGVETEVFTMSYRGPDLEKWLALCAGGAIDPFREADCWLRLVWHLLDTVLLPFHARGFVHCDLKPDNVCLPAVEVHVDGEALTGYLDLRELSLIDLGSALGPVEEDERGRTRLRCNVSVVQGETEHSHARYVSDYYAERIRDPECRLALDGRADLYSLAYWLRRLVLALDTTSTGDGPWPQATLREDIAGGTAQRALLRNLPGLIWNAADRYENNAHALPHAALAATLRQVTPANEDRWFFRVPMHLEGQDWRTHRTRAESALRSILGGRAPEAISTHSPMNTMPFGSTRMMIDDAPSQPPAQRPAQRPPPLRTTPGTAAPTAVFTGEATAANPRDHASPIRTTPPAPPVLPRITPPVLPQATSTPAIPNPYLGAKTSASDQKAASAAHAHAAAPSSAASTAPNPYVQANPPAPAAEPPTYHPSQATSPETRYDTRPMPQVEATHSSGKEKSSALLLLMIIVGILAYSGLIGFLSTLPNDEYSAEEAEPATEAIDYAGDAAAAAGDAAAAGTDATAGADAAAGDAAADAAAEAGHAAVADELPAILQVDGCYACGQMMPIDEGSFLMGSPPEEADRHDDEGPQHHVYVSAFQIGRTEVTQAQWQAVMGENPSQSSDCGPACPVDSVSGEDIDRFIAKLNALDPNWDYGLPTEAQWEYAARAGTTTRYWWGDNFAASSNTSSVSRADAFSANPWGLYQVHGSVFELTRGCLYAYQTADQLIDGSWSARCSARQPWRIMRGGSWAQPTDIWRSAFRGSISQEKKYLDVGFRLMRTPSEEAKK